MSFNHKKGGADATRLTTSARTAKVWADGELLYDTDTDTFYVGDGTTAGGVKDVVQGDITPEVSAIAASNIDWSSLFKKGGLYTKTLVANTTFTFSNATAGQTIVVRIINGSSWTLTWPTVKWQDGTPPVMSASNSAIFTIIYDGTNYFGSYVLNMS
jgi:hypothetical protein